MILIQIGLCLCRTLRTSMRCVSRWKALWRSCGSSFSMNSRSTPKPLRIDRLLLMRSVPQTSAMLRKQTCRWGTCRNCRSEKEKFTPAKYNAVHLSNTMHPVYLNETLWRLSYITIFCCYCCCPLCACRAPSMLCVLIWAPIRGRMKHLCVAFRKNVRKLLRKSNSLELSSPLPRQLKKHN